MAMRLIVIQVGRCCQRPSPRRWPSTVWSRFGSRNGRYLRQFRKGPAT